LNASGYDDSLMTWKEKERLLRVTSVNRLRTLRQLS